MIGEVLILRHTFTNEATFGTLYVNGSPVCYTLEDADRLGLGFKKIYGRTAIPEGTYTLQRHVYSARFKKALPAIVGVEGFEGIKIHSGNLPADTEGCPLVGNLIRLNSIGESRVAFEHFTTLLYEEEKKLAGKVPTPYDWSLTVKRGFIPSRTIEILRECWEEDVKEWTA